MSATCGAAETGTIIAAPSSLPARAPASAAQGMTQLALRA